MVQVASPPGEPVAARLDRVGQLVAEASGADLVVLPELWAPGYFAFDRYEQLAEPLAVHGCRAVEEQMLDYGLCVGLAAAGAGAASPAAKPVLAVLT